jgi:hypothetical protein
MMADGSSSPSLALTLAFWLRLRGVASAVAAAAAAAVDRRAAGVGERESARRDVRRDGWRGVGRVREWSRLCSIAGCTLHSPGVVLAEGSKALWKAARCMLGRR